MLTYILSGLGLLIIALVIVVTMQPNDFRITRSASIKAPPSAIFPEVNDLHKWDGWSPWAKLDPHTKNTFSGADTGTGAVLNWDGNKDVGAGQMTIIDSEPNTLIKIDLKFFKPFKATNLTVFTFKPENDHTIVTWSMSGTNNFMGKAINLVMNCDKMVGGMFDTGLANLKTIAEAKK